MSAGEEVVPASEYRASQGQVRELQRLLGKKTLENAILREALDRAQPKKDCFARPRPNGTTRREDDRPRSGRPARTWPSRQTLRCLLAAAGDRQSPASGPSTIVPTGSRKHDALYRAERRRSHAAERNVFPADRNF